QPIYSLFPYTTLFRSTVHRDERDGIVRPFVLLLPFAVESDVLEKSFYSFERGEGRGSRLIESRDEFLQIADAALGGLGSFLGTRSEEHTSELQSPYDL